MEDTVISVLVTRGFQFSESDVSINTLGGSCKVLGMDYFGQLENTETRERKLEWERKRERERKLENMETRWAIEPGAASESELLESKAKGSTEC